MKKVNILDFSCVKDFELNPSAKAKLKKFYCGFRDIYCLKVKILFDVYLFNVIFDLNNLKIKLWLKNYKLMHWVFF